MLRKFFIKCHADTWLLQLVPRRCQLFKFVLDGSVLTARKEEADFQQGMLILPERWSLDPGSRRCKSLRLSQQLQPLCLVFSVSAVESPSRVRNAPKLKQIDVHLLIHPSPERAHVHVFNLAPCFSSSEVLQSDKLTPDFQFHPVARSGQK